MTKEEFRSLKSGDRIRSIASGLIYEVMGTSVTVAVPNGLFKEIHADQLILVPGPTLPPDVAEVFEWDGEAKGFKQEAGWVWHDGWPCPHHGINYVNVWRLIPKIRKEPK